MNAIASSSEAFHALTVARLLRAQSPEEIQNGNNTSLPALNSGAVSATLPAAFNAPTNGSTASTASTRLALSWSAMFGNGTSTARMLLGSTPFFLSQYSTETWITPPMVGVAISLPLRSLAEVMPDSLETISWVDGLSSVSNTDAATATTSSPLDTAFNRSGAVLGANSNCLPTVPGNIERFCATLSVTSRLCLAKNPFSFATQAGSHVTTGI